jgi:putative transcriptional regulator
MSDEAFSELKAAFQEAIDYERGKRADLRTTKFRLPPAPKRMSAKAVIELRQKLNFSQAMFARLLNVSPRTVQDWEQGRRPPSDAALRLLVVAGKHPEALMDAY